MLDKPERLVQSTNAVNDEAMAIKIIRQDLGAEVAKIASTPLPNEPAGPDSPSLESESLLDRIRNYRNLPENIEFLDERRDTRTSATGSFSESHLVTSA